MKLTERTFQTFASHATLSEVLIAPRPGRGIALQNLIATSDKAASVIQFYDVADAIAPAAEADAGQADFAVALGAVDADDLLVLFTPGVESELQLLTASSVSDDETAELTTVTASGNLAFALTTGSRIYKLTAGASIPVGAATKDIRLAPAFLLVGEEYKPMLIRVDGTSACSIGLASGEYAE